MYTRLILVVAAVLLVGFAMKIKNSYGMTPAHAVHVEQLIS
jgi:hypothetical protein